MSFYMGWHMKFTRICQPMLKSQHIMASMNYFDSDMDNSTNMVVCTVMSHTIFAAKFEQMITR